MAIDTPAAYKSITLQLVEELSPSIASAAEKFGISPLALAGVIAEEFDDTQQELPTDISGVFC